VPVGGDIITAVNNQPVNTMQELQTALQQVKLDQAVTLTILRDGKQVDVPITFSNAS
jgi:S1-C subfamily serine protease